jgi:hypothetical protein
MPVSRKAARSGKAFAVPLLGALLLVACYVILSAWQDLPNLINSAIIAVQSLV